MEIVKTGDGSLTLFNSEVGEHYHSKHGALQESKHVFLGSGLEHFLSKHDQKSVSVLEVGFGTGLNYLLTADYCFLNQITLNYIGIERSPLNLDMIIQTENLNYVSAEVSEDFKTHYDGALKNRTATISGELMIEVIDVKDYKSDESIDVVYFDAFAAIHQPEMWTEDVLNKVCCNLKPGGVFVTYAITGNLKRTMKALGFNIEKAPGALGKREMLRATKL